MILAGHRVRLKYFPFTGRTGVVVWAWPEPLSLFLVYTHLVRLDGQRETLPCMAFELEVVS